MKRDEANIDDSRQENDTRSEDRPLSVTTFPESDQNQIPNAVFTNTPVAPLSTVSDKDIIVPGVVDANSEMAPDVASSLSLEPLLQSPKAIEPSVLSETKPKPDAAEPWTARPFIKQPDYTLREEILTSRDDILAPAIVDAPREERPSFIGELIETPKPIILPNQPVPNAPRLPLADPASHLETPAFVFASDTLPPVQARNEMQLNERGQALSLQMVNEGVAPGIEPSSHNTLGLLKSSEEASSEIDQNLITNSAPLISPALEIVAQEKSENVEKTPENKVFLTDLSSRSADLFIRNTTKIYLWIGT